jgi:hypothetical protein
MKTPSWFIIKNKLKQKIRSFFYSKWGQNLLCLMVVTYIKIVYFTSKKIFIGDETVMQRFKDRQPTIIAMWHRSIMLCPFISNHIKKVNKVNKIASLASKHGDGKLVGNVMKKFDIINIAGSTRDSKISGRGINISDLKAIFRALKDQLGLAITPDGPRGPSQKINGEIIKIAKLSSVPILPAAIGYSRFFLLNSWDKLIIPFPFGKICYCYGDLFFVDKNSTEQEIANLNSLLEQKINLVAQSADKISQNQSKPKCKNK